ncbi:alpha beta-hydrolases superfamily protein [Klebsormidium nitens]|uniref:protein-S-isoprenylcysteine alpha-carbonyl methylesterase n=1 Tax=Klebsormidium nitens TaxID=105231 RepID=A0A1Y1IHW5_KLENI|nr:alpha beta-hydrolases superfamily protein [Klebsormidium nitens]|eukprot:GAQ90293.1 alpha beta-hydrolases superfamily protein [Klebsormidium nitens]
MAIFGHAFKSAGSDVASTRGFGPKMSKAAKYSYLIGKEIVGLVQVIPYGLHAALTHGFLPLGKGLQQDLVGGLGQLGQGVGLSDTDELKASNDVGMRSAEEEETLRGDSSDEIGSAVDLNPRNSALQERRGDEASVGLHSSVKVRGAKGRAAGWFPWKSAYSANVVKDLPYGDKEREKLDIFTPSIMDQNRRSASNQKWPVVLFVHGGVWSSGEKWQYSPLGARLAHEGCVAAVISYSLFPDVLATEQSEQVSSALDWVFQNIGHFGGDPNRVTLAGHSSGAHICSLALYHRAKRLLASRASPRMSTDVSVRQPRTFAGLAGVYDIAEHLKFEQWRGVALLSCMTPANGGPEGFPDVSTVRLFESLGAEVGKSERKEDGFEGEPFLGETSEANRVVLGMAEGGQTARSRPWKEWPFSTVVNSALLAGGRLGSSGEIAERKEDENGPESNSHNTVSERGTTDVEGLNRGGEATVRVEDLLPRVLLQSSPGDTTVPIDTTVAFARCLDAIGCRVKNLVYDSLAHPDFIIWPRRFDGEEALGPHIRDLLRVVKGM